MLKNLKNNILIITGTAVLSSAFLGLLYGMYKIATSDKELYSIIIYTIVSIFIIYKIISSIKSKKFKKALLEITKFFSYLVIIFIFLLIYLLGIAIIIRTESIKIIIPVAALLFISYIIIRLKPLSVINRIFSKIN